MNNRIKFPTILHEQMAEVAAEFFTSQPQVDTILVVNSCARGQATPESDLDMAVLVKPEVAQEEIRALEGEWAGHLSAHPLTAEYKKSGRFAQVHLDIITAQYVPTVWDDGGGPDYFEVEIGNQIAHSAPLGEVGTYFQVLKARWLPYYGDTLQQERMEMVRAACEYDLEHVPFFAKRGLPFQAFDRLYKAHQEFLQALFISRRTYPIAYNKWIREQVAVWLAAPQLYAQLPRILSIHDLENVSELETKAAFLRSLAGEWLSR
ncbi:MAG: nucleotidyltransferase domain-containing protein [Chloroflexi bacterium]|nr:nucleotidyltransferase domain-containing protein [Chloroflexota bacterium]